MPTNYVFNDRWYMDASKTYWENCDASTTNDVNNRSTESKLKAIRSMFSEEINDLAFDDSKEK
jgi:hypothetical protein